MKLKFVTSTLILAAVGSAAFAQGTKGHHIGYSLTKDNGVVYSSSNTDRLIIQERRVYGDGSTRIEDMETKTVTIYPSTLDAASIDRAPR